MIHDYGEILGVFRVYKSAKGRACMLLTQKVAYYGPNI